MDEVDRPAEGQEPSPRAPINMSNLPQPSEDVEPYDEVDRPSTIKFDTDETMLKPETPNQKEANTDSQELKLNTNKRTDDTNHDFENIDTPVADDHLNGESQDGPPRSSANGPFSPIFQKQNPLIQHRSERTDKEGILSKHTTYYPQQPDKKSNSKAKHEVNSDSFYSMDTFPRGKLTLINVKDFQSSSGMADYPRHGTDKDADGLVSLFVDLGFVVDRFDNPTKKEMMSILKGAANEDYSKLSCCACSILTHGEEGIIYGTDGFVKIKDITKLFRSRGLAGKPKFFLFQACQGPEYMDPVDSVDGPGRLVPTDDDMALTLPSEADFLYAYSTVPGYNSWRNSRRGSWFMEAVCSIFRENAHKMDVIRMLTRVNSTVAHRKSRTEDEVTDDKRQIASIVSQMRKDFFLFPPSGPLSKWL